MKLTRYLFLFCLCISILTATGCKKNRKGCTDPGASNYDSKAHIDDGNCVYKGRILFFVHDATSCNCTSTITVRVSNIVKGDVYVTSDTLQSCTTCNGCLEVDVNGAGTFHWEATCNYCSQTGSVTLGVGDCKLVDLSLH